MDNCPVCGVDREVWGRHHICRPLHRSGVNSSMADSKPAGVGATPTSLATYKYRDPDKRRPQVAAAMRAYRARKKLST